MWTIFKERIWLIFLLVGTVYGNPYYYREEKHQTEHHKEYSYKGQPASLNPPESAPQKYYDSSHLSSYGTPERYYKLESSPTFSSGFSQYSGGQSSYHQSGFQSSGISGASGHLLPLTTGKSINIEGIQPGTYVIKQVKIYGNPSTYTSQTGYFGSSSQNGQLEGRGLETGQKVDSLYAGQYEKSLGQKEESLYKGQHEVGLNEGAGGYVKQHIQATSLYQVPHAVQTVRQGESLYGQKLVDIDKLSGQKEDSLYSQQIERGDISQKEESPYELPFEEFDPKPERGDLATEQVEEDLNKHNFHLVKPIQSLPVSDGQGGYKYYEKRIITYGAPSQESNIYKQTYRRHESTHTGLNSLGNPEILYGPTTIKSPIGYENVHTGSKQQIENIRYRQEGVIAPRPQTYPVSITPPKESKVQSHVGQQSYTGSLEVGQHEESFYGQHSEDLGQQQVSGSLELGQPEGQQLVPGSLEFGQPEGQQLVPGSLEFGQPEGQQLVPGSLEFGQPEGQQLVPGSLEFGQPDCDGQQLMTGAFEVGQKEENTSGQQTQTWQSQVNTSKLEVSGQRTKPTQGSYVQLGNAGQHVEIGRLDVSSHNKPNILVKQNVTRTLIVGHSLPVNPSLVKAQNKDILKSYREDSIYGQNIEKDHLQLGQKEESLGQLGTGILEIGQHEETLETGQQSENFGQQPDQGDLLVGQKEVNFNLQIPDSDNLELGQREESSFGLVQSKGIPYAKPTKQTNQHKTTSFGKTYNRHESYYNEFKQTQKKEQKDTPMYEQKLDLTTIPSNIDRESIDKNHRTNYLQLQRKAEELALQLALGDNTKEKSATLEKEVYIKKLRAKEPEPTTSTTEVYVAEVQELGLVKQHLQEVSVNPEKKLTTWETHKEEYGLNYPLPSHQTAYSSKKHTKHSYMNQGYPQSISENYGYQKESQHSPHGESQQGYMLTGGTYFNDQPIQKSHTSGSQFSFSSSSSGSSQDKHKVIDDFLKELDKDIAKTNYQQRQQQGSYAQISPTISTGSGVSYYSQKTVSSHSSSVHSSGGTTSGDAAKSWYQKIGDSIGSGYSQAKDKAKEIVKTVKQSVGYTNS